MMQTGTVILDDAAMRGLLSKHFKAYIDGFKSIEKIKKKTRKADATELMRGNDEVRVTVYQISFRFKETV